MLVNVTYFEDEPLFTSLIMFKFISQVLPIYLPVMVVSYMYVVDQSNLSSLMGLSISPPQKTY